VRIDGIVMAREVRVRTDVYADYVFNRNYSLMNLKELETFIKENKHLPGIPKEKDVLEEGIDLAAMNVKLLEKVEELTLYIIQQNKRIEALENANTTKP